MKGLTEKQLSLHQYGQYDQIKLLHWTDETHSLQHSYSSATKVYMAIQKTNTRNAAAI